MLEKIRNIGKVVVGGMVTFSGLLLFLLFITGLMAFYDVFIRGTTENLPGQLAAMAIFGLLVLFIGWIHFDATRELSSIKRQKEEFKNLDTKSAPPPEIPTREPWLYP